MTKGDVTTITTQVEFEIEITETFTTDGVWFEAKSKLGNCNSNSKEDCIRIIKEKIKWLD